MILDGIALLVALGFLLLTLGLVQLCHKLSEGAS